LKETRFGGLANTFKLMKQSIENLPERDMLVLRHNAFQAFVADILDRFELYPELASVKLVHNLNQGVRTNNSEAIYEGLHEVWVFAKASGLDPDAAPEEHEAYVREMIPYPLMGAGTFELARDDVRVQRFLGLRSFDAGDWYGLVAEISQDVNRAFGFVRAMHTLA